ncbi:MAG: winged helix DNA-binding protein [Acidobacteria bacterium]|nr:winged helix DNA-binding protein [Acidobacteriota bacterium]
MRVKNPSALIDEFLGSTHIFAQVVENIVQENLVKQASDGTLTYSQFKLLKLVTMSDLISIGDVAAFLSISNAAASKAVDRLVRKRLIQRAEFAKDRRAVQLSPTEAGARIIGTYEELKARHLPKIFSAVQASKLKGVSQLLDGLSVRLVERAPERARTTCLQCGIFYRRSCLMRLQANRSCFYHDRRTRKSTTPRHEKTLTASGHR